MGYSVDILNNVRLNASQEYKTRIPTATQTNITEVGNALQEYGLMFTEFVPTLICKIGKTIIETKLFENKLAKFKMGAADPHDVEEIFIEMASAEGSYDNKGLNPLGRRAYPDVKSIYHRENRRDYYAKTIGDVDVVTAFRSEANLDNFIRGIINSIYSGANYDEYLAMKNLLSTYDGYYDYEVSAITNEATAKQFLKTLRKASQDISFAATEYNKAHVKTWTPVERQVLFINKDVLVEVDVEVLAKAFNMGKTDIQVDIVALDNFGESTDTYGLLVDRDILRVWDTLSKMETQRNAQGLFTNYFYHVHQILSMSTFKNAIKFKLKA